MYVFSGSNGSTMFSYSDSSDFHFVPATGLTGVGPHFDKTDGLTPK